MMLVEPLIGSAVDKAVRLMVDPIGARRGTFSHATVRRTKLVKRAPRAHARRRRNIIKTITILVGMKLTVKVAGGATRPLIEHDSSQDSAHRVLEARPLGSVPRGS